MAFPLILVLAKTCGVLVVLFLSFEEPSHKQDSFEREWREFLVPVLVA